MKTLTLTLSMISALSISGAVAASGNISGDAEINRLTVNGAASPSSSSLVLYRDKSTAEMCYQLLDEAVVDGRRVSRPVEQGTWDVSRVAFDGEDTLYILSPDDGAPARYALRSSADSLQFLSQ
jgi:hypothetical protein